METGNSPAMSKFLSWGECVEGVVMKKFFALSFLMLLAIAAQAEPPEERVVLFVGNSENAQKQAAGMSELLVQSGPSFEVAALDPEEAATLSLSLDSAYLARQLGQQIVWLRPLESPQDAWQQFQAQPYDVEEGALLSWAQVVPQSTETPLRKDELVEFYAGGLPGLKAEAQIGGKTVPLFEERPGYYAGAYRVTAEDRVKAQIGVRAFGSEQQQEHLPVGELAVQGLQTPQVTALGQTNVRDWVLQGEASPGNRVEVSIDIPLGGLFGRNVLRRKVEALADSEGKFEAKASLGTLSSSPMGTIRVKSIDSNGVEVVGPDQEVRFRSRVRVVYRPYDPVWGYPGYWRRPFYGRRFLRRGCR